MERDDTLEGGDYTEQRTEFAGTVISHGVEKRTVEINRAGELEDAQHVGESFRGGGGAIVASRARKLDAKSFNVSAAAGILGLCQRDATSEYPIAESRTWKGLREFAQR